MRASWKVDEVQRIVSRLSPERLASWRPLAERTLAGAGVDVATGQVVLVEDEGVLSGVLAVRRTYSSGFAHRAGALGRGWMHVFEQRVHCERAGFVLFDGAGRELLFEHEGEARPGLAQRHALDPRITLRHLGPGIYAVDEEGGAKRTFEARDPKGAATLASIELGAETAWITSDDAGRPLAVASAGHRLSLVYEGTRLRSIELVLASGHVLELARHRYDASGDLASVTLPEGRVRAYEMAGGLLVRRVRPDGSADYFGYDDVGSAARCVRTWSDGGYDDRKLRYRRGATTVTDGTGASHTFEHDALHRPLALPSGRIVYDARTLGALRFEGPELTREAELDAAGRPVAMKEADGTQARYEYDGAGRVSAELDRAGARVEVRRAADGTTLERVEDGARELVRTNERGATEIVVGDEWLEVEVDRARRPTRVALRDEVWSARYDVLGRPESLSSPGGERRFEHDVFGRLSAIEVDGVRASFERDAQGRLVRARMPEGDWTIERDRGGQPRTVVRPDFACELVFDAERRLVEVRDRRGRRWIFERDRSGRVVVERDSDGREHRYSYAGVTRRVARVTMPGGERLLVVRDAMGRVIRAEHGNAHVDRFAHDAAGRLVEAARDSVAVRLTRDRRGSVVNERHGEDEIGARYDARGRRALVVSSLGARIARTWGPRGERVLDVAAPDGSRHVVELAGDMLRAGALHVTRAPDDPPLRGSGEGEVERDALGRIVAWTGRDQRRFVYGYGADGLIEQVTLPTGDVWRFEYDAFGRRLAARSEHWEARWVWDGGVALHEVTSYAPPTLYVYDPADGAPVGKVQPGAPRWLGAHQDFVCLFDPANPGMPTPEYWPWRGGLQIDFPTGLWLGHGRAFHPRAAEPMGYGSLADELFGPAERRPFDYRPRVAALLDRASDAALRAFVHRLTTPAWLELARTPPVPWPEPIAQPRVVPTLARV